MSAPSKVGKGTLNDLDKELESIRRRSIAYERKLKKAEASGTVAEIKFWSDTRLKWQEALVKLQLAKAKLGLDQGDFLPKADAEQILFAVASRIAVGVSRLRDQLAPRLVGINNSPEIAELIEPKLVMELLYSPLTTAEDMAAKIGCPKWVVEAIRDNKESYVEE